MDSFGKVCCHTCCPNYAWFINTRSTKQKVGHSRLQWTTSQFYPQLPSWSMGAQHFQSSSHIPALDFTKCGLHWGGLQAAVKPKNWIQNRTWHANVFMDLYTLYQVTTKKPAILIYTWMLIAWHKAHPILQPCWNILNQFDLAQHDRRKTKIRDQMSSGV